MTKNPIPVLHEHCQLKVSGVAQFYPPGTPLEVMHRLFRPGIPIDAKLHAKLLDMTLSAWGDSDDHKVRRALWECYFPDTLPHIYHLLAYRHHQWHRLDRATGYSDAVLRSIMAQPKLHRRQLRRIGKFASTYIESLANPKREGAEDPQFLILERALKDKKRLYDKHEIVQDKRH